MKLSATTARRLGWVPVEHEDIREGDQIRAELPMSTNKAAEYIAERDAHHKGFDCTHYRFEDPVPTDFFTDEPVQTNPHQLPWAPPFLWWKRCKARRSYDGRNPHHGRCGLRRHHDGDHALDRGLDTPRWSTEWTA